MWKKKDWIIIILGVKCEWQQRQKNQSQKVVGAIKQQQRNGNEWSMSKFLF